MAAVLTTTSSGIWWEGFVKLVSFKAAVNNYFTNACQHLHGRA